MDTPPPRQLPQDIGGDSQPSRKYTEDEKEQLLANLDLEGSYAVRFGLQVLTLRPVKDRIRQFEAYLAHSLEAFKLRHENEVTRIPRAIRTLTMAEFADKYDGDVSKALQAITKARLEATGEPVGADASVRKRHVLCFVFPFPS